MSVPRFIPRKFLSGNHRFGRGSVPEDAWEAPAPTDEPTDVYAVAARLQHEIATQIHLALSSTGTGAKDVSAIGHFSMQRWQRVLRGEVVMRLEDLAAVQLATGCRIRITLEEDYDPLNPWGAARRVDERAAIRQIRTITQSRRAQVRDRMK